MTRWVWPDHYFAHVDMSGGPDACWPWKGSRRRNGYGRLERDGRGVAATHVALELDGRPLGPGQYALHRCDNPPCVNPAHLYAGDSKDNALDMLARGRQRRGADNPNSRLTAERVREIRALFTAGVTVRQLACRFDIAESTVRQVVTGKTWTQVLERVA